MMQKNIAILAVLIHLFFVGKAQDPGQNLNKWSLLNPIEKAHLHLDRQSYFSGQTIWFKGYLVSEYAPSIKSTTLYVEFLNNQGGIISRKVLPVYQGSTQGQFDLPDTLQSGSYQLRAYTPLMLNQPGFWYSSRITVFGKTSIQNQNPLPRQTTLLQFFPEGGNLIKGLVNNVAFKATDPYGLPVKVTGRVMNAKNELVCPLNSIHDGMGTFTLIPLADEAYFVELDGVPGTKYDLPVATTKGIALNVRQSRRGVECTITQLRGDDNFRAAYMIGQMQNNVVFRVDFNNAKDQFSTIFKTDELLSGILQITLFNKYGMPLAERLSFVNNKEYMMAGELIADTLNISERKRNHFSLQIPDTVIGSFSVSVTDADFEESPYRQQNMYSSLLLTNDIRGYVHNPAYYFTGPADSAKRALDLVMMTNGWTRFKWVDAAANTLPLPLYKSPGYISLAGKINIEGTRKAFANKDLMVMFKPVDSTVTGSMQLIHTDSLGNFKMDSVIFYDRVSMLFSDIRGKKSKFIKVKMDADSLNKKYPVETLRIPFKSQADAATENKMKEEYSNYLKAEGLMLANVTVKTRQKSKTEQMEDRYSSSLFAGSGNSRVLDLRNETITNLDIFDYLRGRIPGLTIDRDNEGQYRISYRDGGMGSGNVSLYLDEMRTDAIFIESIPVNQIAYVKLMPHFAGSFGGGTALAVYMKKGAELSAATEAATDIINYTGYSVIKEFYSPNYAVRLPETDKADNRLTLLWNPNLYLANINPKIPLIFYNNDRTKRFKVVVEGMTSDGKMMMVEKIFEPGKK